MITRHKHGLISKWKVILFFTLLSVLDCLLLKQNSYHRNSRHSKVTRLHLIDQIQSSVDTLHAVSAPDAFVTSFNDSFFSTFSGKILGALFANILIGISIKLIGDLVFKKIAESTKPKGFDKPTSIETLEKPKLNIPINAYFNLLICIAIGMLHTIHL